MRIWIINGLFQFDNFLHSLSTKIPELYWTGQSRFSAILVLLSYVQYIYIEKWAQIIAKNIKYIDHVQ